MPAVAAVARCTILLKFVSKQPRKESLTAMLVSNSRLAAAGDEKLAATPEESAHAAGDGSGQRACRGW